MNSDQQNDFQTGNAQSAFSKNQQAGTIKKGGYCMLKGFPCKVTQISTSKPGKHGSAKANFVGTDIFTNKKYQDSCPTSCNIQVPIIDKQEYQLLMVNQDSYCYLLAKGGQKREDLKTPDDDEKLMGKLNQYIQKENSIVYVQVMKSCGKEKIVEVRYQQ